METTFLTEFLTAEQIWGDDRGRGQLQVMKGYGTKTGMSDLAIVLGGLMGSSNKTSDDQLSGYLWSASSYDNGSVRTVHFDGDRYFYYPYMRLGGARPALPSSVTPSIKLTSDVSAEALAKGEARLSRKIGDIEVMEYGEYPQTIAKPDAAKELNSLSADELEKIKTGKKYTFDGEKLDAYDKPFDEEKVRQNDPKYVHPEYQHNGKKYIRVEARPCDSHSVLSNGHRVEKGEKCWIEVQPIEWLKDPSGVWVARQALFSGVQFDRNREYHCNFAKTDMKQYLDNYFSKEMLSARDAHKAHRQEQLERAKANHLKRKQQAPDTYSLTDSPGTIDDWERENPAANVAMRWNEAEKESGFPRDVIIDYTMAYIQAADTVRKAGEVKDETAYREAVQSAFAKNIVQKLRAAGRIDDAKADDPTPKAQIIGALHGTAKLPGTHTPDEFDREISALEKKEALAYGKSLGLDVAVVSEQMPKTWAARRAKLKSTHSPKRP